MNSRKLPQKGSLLSALQQLASGPVSQPKGPERKAPAPQKLLEPAGVAPAGVGPAGKGLSPAERRFLLALARRALQCAVTGDGRLPEPPAGELAPGLREKRACFVTLTKAGKLRGCVGQVLARAPLYQAVATTARSAALCDPRFSPVRAEEVPHLRIELSVLTAPQPLSFASPDELLQQLRPHEHGVILSLGSRLTTFLPQVWEHLPDKTEFLNRLAQKAGGPASAWRTQEASLMVYQVEAFQEN